jgi:hypothetical protein
MRCSDCNTLLSDYEATRRDKETEEYMDLCGACYGSYRQSMRELDDTEERTKNQNIFNKY